MIDPVEAGFCAHMRTLARKGGATTKQRHGYDPAYYRDIGRLGGHASVAALTAKITAEFNEVESGEAPVVEPTATLAEAPVSEPIDTAPDTRATARSPITIAEVLADRKRFGPRRPELSKRQRILDAIAQDSLARAISGASIQNPNLLIPGTSAANQPKQP